MENPIPSKEFDTLLKRASKMLNVHEDQYDGSIRHTVVKETLAKALGDDRVRNMPLGVERRNLENYVTWTGTNTVLGNVVNHPGFKLLTETRVTRLEFMAPPSSQSQSPIAGVSLKDLNTGREYPLVAKVREEISVL